MKIKVTFDSRIVGKNKTKSQDGKNTYYKIAIVTPEGMAGNVSCEEEVYDLVKDLMTYEFSAIYNDEYKSFKVNYAKLKEDVWQPGSMEEGA